MRVERVDAGDYKPGAKIRLRITVEDPGARRWGFSLTVRMSADRGVAAGSFNIIDTANTRLGVTEGGPPFVTHTPAGTWAGKAQSASWEVEWTGPQLAANVSFSATGVAANRDNSELGDYVYVGGLFLSTPGSPSTTTKILPQFAFGGGYYTAIYLHNTNDSPAAVKIDFFGNEGQALAIPLMSGSSINSNLPAYGTVLLEAPNRGDLQQGWARLELPLGVIGYGVFRQSVAGRADQEALVPFSPAASANSALIYDDSGLTTALAVANPTSSPVNVTLAARSNTGAMIGSSSIGIPARGKTAFTLRDRIPSAAGQRGSSTFALSSGAASVLGLRFAGEAFTSIPAVEPARASSPVQILPQFAFGGGYYTAVYLHNRTPSSAQVKVQVFDDNGDSLNVPSLGGSTVTANVAAGGIALLEAQDIGPLRQGWARIGLPDGVIGYGLFRQSVAGRPDQEAIIPLSGTVAIHGSWMIFDDSGLTSAIAIVNPGISAPVVSVVAVSSTGGLLGQTNIILRPGRKVAFNLKDRFPGIEGQRGAIFIVSNFTTAVNVLGLRFGGEAFTSIPVTQR